jgi:hypothetical protein
MSKPNKTAADYMVIAISPVLIMALVGSLCFFLIEVFYRGKMEGGVQWVMFWYVLAIVLISRIAIEQTTEYAAVYGAALALAVWLYLVRTHPAYLLAIVLLAVVWFCAHKLVWDCTLIDEDQDSSGQGLLQAAPSTVLPKTVETKAAGKKLPGRKPKKRAGAQSPGRWVVYFSLAALPLFGIGQMLLPAGVTGGRRRGFMFLAIYLAAGLGLLLTTSFLGLRRYLRQRYLKMPPSIAVGWLKFGVLVAVVVLVGAVFLPRPGANEAWASLRYQIDYQLRRASRYASRENAPGTGEGREGEQGAEKGKGQGEPKPEQGPKQGGGKQPSEAPKGPTPTSRPLPSVGSMYDFLRTALLIVVALVVGGWIIRRRYLLLEMLRSAWASMVAFWRKLLEFGEIGRPAKRVEPPMGRPRHRSFTHYKNPFFTGRNEAWPPEQILIYTYEALQVWAKEQGIEARPHQTPREFCAELGDHRPQVLEQMGPLAHLYAYAAYGRHLPPDCDLEPIKELWRIMAVPGTRTEAAAR